MPHPNDEIEPRVGLMFRMPESIHKACKIEALKQRRSLTDQLLIMIEDWFEHEEPPTPCPTCHTPVGAGAD